MFTVRRNPFERFTEKVEPEPGTGCWLWSGPPDTHGYGRFWCGERLVAAHRFAYSAFVGPIPDGMCVLHRCDTPLCVNPEHLFLGTHTDNMRDMVMKGRNGYGLPRGERNGNAKLTAEDVRSIRARCATGETQVALGREFGVPQSHISAIVCRKRWTHI